MSSPFPSPTYSTPTIDSTECANQRPVLLEDQQTFTSLLGDMSPANTSSPNTLSAIPTACAWCAPSGAEHGGYCDHQVPLRNGVSATPALHPTEIPPNVAVGITASFDNARFIHPPALDVMPDHRFDTTSAVAHEQGINNVYCDTQTGPMLSPPFAGIPMDLPGDLPLAYTSSSNTLSAIPTDCAWHAPSGAVHGSYSGHQIPLRNGVSATPALHPTDIPPNVVAGITAPFDNARFVHPRTLDVMPDPRFDTTSAFAQERGINASCCDSQTGPMLSRSSARQPLNTAWQHGFQFNYLHRQSPPLMPQLSPAQADTVLQPWPPALTTSPHIPAPVLASNFSPLRLSPQTIPPRAQSTTPTYTALLSPPTPQHFYFTEPY